MSAASSWIINVSLLSLIHGLFFFMISSSSPLSPFQNIFKSFCIFVFQFSFLSPSLSLSISPSILNNLAHMYLKVDSVWSIEYIVCAHKYTCTNSLTQIHTHTCTMHMYAALLLHKRLLIAFLFPLNYQLLDDNFFLSLIVHSAVKSFFPDP